MSKQYYKGDIAKSYGKDDFGVYKAAREIAIQQLIDIIHAKPLETVLDIAVGQADSLLAINEHFTVKHLIANDYSPHMLKIAKQRLPALETIHDSALNIDQHNIQADLILAHFVFSYINASQLWPLIKKTTKPGGYFSIMTANLNNLEEMQDLLQENLSWFFNKEKVWQTYENGLPESTEQLCQTLSQQGFKIIQQETLTMPVVFNSLADVWEYCVEEGWHIQFFDVTGNRRIDKLLTYSVVKTAQCLRPKLRFPVQGSTNISIVTVQA